MEIWIIEHVDRFTALRKAIARMAREERKRQGLRQGPFGERHGLSQQTVSGIENGAGTLEHLAALIDWRMAADPTLTMAEVLARVASLAEMEMREEAAKPPAAPLPRYDLGHSAAPLAAGTPVRPTSPRPLPPSGRAAATPAPAPRPSRGTPRRPGRP